MDVYIIRGKINIKIFITLGKKNSKIINVYIIEGLIVASTKFICLKPE